MDQKVVYIVVKSHYSRAHSLKEWFEMVQSNLCYTDYMEINVNYEIYVVKMFLLFNSTQLLLIKRNNRRCNDPQKHLIILYLNSRV